MAFLFSSSSSSLFVVVVALLFYTRCEHRAATDIGQSCLIRVNNDDGDDVIISCVVLQYG